MESIKGKAFAHTKDRNKNDYYPTPYSMTEQLLELEDFRHGTILEPACGNAKAICRVIEKKGLKVVSKDIEAGQDFFKESGKYDFIITNPPYKLADQFVEKCKGVAIEKFALLLRTNFLSGVTRFNEDRFKGLKNVYIFTRMADLNSELRADGKYKTAMIVYAWMVWELHFTGKPQLNWIDNQKFVLKKGDE